MHNWGRDCRSDQLHPLLRALRKLRSGLHLGQGGGAPLMRRALSVAEKPSVAKELANILSNGQARRREGASPYNTIFEFQCPLDNGQCTMLVTSVVGHLLEARPARVPSVAA